MDQRNLDGKGRPARHALGSLILLLCAPLCAEVYKWHDDQGRLHFSDEPPQQVQAEDLSAQYDYRLPFSIDIQAVDHAPSPDLESRLGVAVRRIFAIYDSVLEVEYDPDQSFRIVLYGNESDFRAYQRQVAPRLENPIGFYSSADNRISALAVDNEDALLALITHECSHAVSASAGRYVPIWLNEGLAEYFSRLRVYGLTAEIPSARHWLQLLRGRGYHRRAPDLSDHINALPPAWQQANGPDNLSYALSWSLVYFLMDSDSGRGLLKALLERADKSALPLLDSAGMIAGHWPGGMAGFTRDWQGWLADAGGKHRY